MTATTTGPEGRPSGLFSYIWQTSRRQQIWLVAWHPYRVRYRLLAERFSL
ncbi:MAG: hypothetical protein R3349_10255 [Geminicoccaceae bacterium]|nr:hypothetical protein [Geminicoccaceae bacterium]